MRIAIDVRATQTGHRNRGIGRSVLDLVAALRNEGGGHEYGLLVQASQPLPFGDLPSNFRFLPVDGPLLSSLLLSREERTWVKSVPRLRSIPLGHRMHEAALLREHRRAIRRALREYRPDVLHWPVPIDSYTEMPRDPGCRTVVTFYDAIPRLDPEHYYDPLPLRTKMQYDRQLASIAKADAVVAISKSSRLEAIEYGGADPAKTFVVYCAVSDDFARESHEEVGGLTQGKPYFLFMSPIDRYKNPLGTIKAFARLPRGHQLVMLSPQQGSVIEEFRRLVQDLGVEDSVTITGVMSDDGVRALVQGATALVSPSFFEGFGLPAAQAMRAGVPAIVSNRKSQPEVAGKDGIIVDPDDVDALAEAMARVAGDSEFRRDLSERGKARAALFSLERLGRNMRDVYEGHPPSDTVPDG